MRRGSLASSGVVVLLVAGAVEVIDRKNRISRTAVRTGRRAQGLVEILKGPAEGSQVAVKGSAFVLDGDEVRIAGSATR